MKMNLIVLRKIAKNTYIFNYNLRFTNQYYLIIATLLLSSDVFEFYMIFSNFKIRRRFLNRLVFFLCLLRDYDL